MKGIIFTHSGQRIDLQNPERSFLSLPDIAHALSNICRFIGHVSQFYSVAEHSVLCAELAWLESPDDWQRRMQALLHDASEAFLGDVSKPLKELLPDYSRLERNIQRQILSQWGLTKDCSASVERYDLIMLKAEKNFLLPDTKDAPEWDGLKHVADHEPNIECWEPAKAEERFLQAFDIIARRRLRGSS